MKNYLEFINNVLNTGHVKKDRTGTGTVSCFGGQLQYNLEKGFPIVTTKKLFFKGVVAELLWFIAGSTNSKLLEKQGVNIWKAWADAEGELGPVYGKQWRSWTNGGNPVVDQLTDVIEQIKSNPNSRRLIVSAWNVGDLEKMALPPCHLLYQFYVAEGKLSCHLYQRSADLFLGVPFNIASYSLLTHMVAQVCGLGVGDFIHSFGDAHIYCNHIDQVREQLKRSPKKLPTLVLNSGIDDIDSFELEDIKLERYHPWPVIKAPVAV